MFQMIVFCRTENITCIFCFKVKNIIFNGYHFTMIAYIFDFITDVFTTNRVRIFFCHEPLEQGRTCASISFP
jgi:hypothetical protein